jgi:hypothetical protein
LYDYFLWGVIIEQLWQFVLGAILAIFLHELTHLLTLKYYKIPFNAIVLTKWSAIGFLVDNETYVTDNKKLLFLYLSPLIWCFMYFINPNEPFFLMFPVVNIFGGMGDFYSFFRLIIIPPEKRIMIANNSDEKVLKKIIWKKNISLNNKLFNMK